MIALMEDNLIGPILSEAKVIHQGDELLIAEGGKQGNLLEKGNYLGW
jgi:hypothetical protein